MGAPLIAGFLNGILMGDVAYGLQMGGSIMLVYIGVAIIGGAISGDPMLGGWLGVTASMMAHAEPEISPLGPTEKNQGQSGGTVCG